MTTTTMTFTQKLIVTSLCRAYIKLIPENEPSGVDSYSIWDALADCDPDNEPLGVTMVGGLETHKALLDHIDDPDVCRDLLVVSNCEYLLQNTYEDALNSLKGTYEALHFTLEDFPESLQPLLKETIFKD